MQTLVWNFKFLFFLSVFNFWSTAWFFAPSMAEPALPFRASCAQQLLQKLKTLRKKRNLKFRTSPCFKICDSEKRIYRRCEFFNRKKNNVRIFFCSEEK